MICYGILIQSNSTEINYEDKIYFVHRGMGSFYKVRVPSAGNLSRTVGERTDRIVLMVLGSEAQGFKVLGFWASGFKDFCFKGS